MIQTFIDGEKWKRMIRVTIPILITQIAMYLMTFFDILMTSRYDTEHLAGVTIGSSFWMPIYTGLAGILLGLTPIIAHFLGAKQNQSIRTAVQQGIYLSFALAGFIFLILTLGIRPFIFSMNLAPLVQEISSTYLLCLCLGLVPLFFYAALRSFFDALGATRVSMFIVLLSAPINVSLNYIFIFGNFGAPALGGAGAGLASALTYWLVLFIAIYIAAKGKKFERYQLFYPLSRPQWNEWKAILVIGLPIGLALFIEISIFSAVTLFISTYSTAYISAHQIALNFTSLLYMIPLSISMGATILVGQQVGAKNDQDAQSYSKLAIILALLFSLLSIGILLGFREQIAGIYTNDPVIIQLAIKFFVFAAFFQLSDAVQAPVQGALRGYKDVTSTFIMAIISYWVIGLPVGYLAANYFEMGPYGYWIGLIVGLTTGAIALGYRLHLVQKRMRRTIL